MQPVAFTPVRGRHAVDRRPCLIMDIDTPAVAEGEDMIRVRWLAATTLLTCLTWWAVAGAGLAGRAVAPGAGWGGPEGPGAGRGHRSPGAELRADLMGPGIPDMWRLADLMGPGVPDMWS
ncbi:hypothetical protein ThesuDRAFT_02005 [Thermaerobacter subterraneus DSM 13965]|uniref:Uncharacterized protein n=2 Tax=Thermaerobacter TaxID=73918 RepID=K6PMY9_9FIRM|nr:hypothetical protein ThesuDRAFT_02005 [Thermaerobacter subterraneus DSM 13965]